MKIRVIINHLLPIIIWIAKLIIKIIFGFIRLFQPVPKQWRLSFGIKYRRDHDADKDDSGENKQEGHDV